MTSSKSVAIGCASAFWGDTPLATAQMLRAAELDYIVYDFLSEVTMTLLARQKKRDVEAGFCADFLTDVIEPHLAEILSRRIRVVSNAGGMNPLSLKHRIQAFAQKTGLNVRIACVLGDDVATSAGVPEGLASANAYLGARPVAQALSTGADIVLTGRIVDSALASGPAMFAHGWKWDDYDLLAQASLAGHLIECGTQCCGGNFTDWEKVPTKSDVGFPIARIFHDGRIEITKVPGTGGMVTTETVAEQLVYEIGDPAAYLLPDVICDFTQVKLKAVGPDVVEATGAKGSPPPPDYKVVATRLKGSRLSATAFIAGAGSGDARKRGLAVGEAVLARARAECLRKGLGDYTETKVEALGGSNEALLRVCAAHSSNEALEILAKEIAPAATSLAPGLTQLLGGRASAAPRIELLSFLVPKANVAVRVDDQPVDVGTAAKAIPTFHAKAVETTQAKSGLRKRVRLIEVALARSGDKGNDVNIGVIARDGANFEALKADLTESKVSELFSREFDNPAKKKVLRYELPGIYALNFLIKDCLGGGGAYSLKIDPQGKAFAQRLLEMEIEI